MREKRKGLPKNVKEKSGSDQDGRSGSAPWKKKARSASSPNRNMLIEKRGGGQEKRDAQKKHSIVRTEEKDPW